MKKEMKQREQLMKQTNEQNEDEDSLDGSVDSR